MVKIYVTVGEAKELFKERLDLLESGWEKDGYLTLDEVNLPGYFNSDFSGGLKAKIADAFLCDSLGSKQFDDATKGALRKCLGIKKEADAGVPPQKEAEKTDGGTEGCKKDVKVTATGCADPSAKVENEIPDDQLPKPFESVIGRENFEKVLAETDKKKSVVLLVWSRNCIHCKHAKPELVKVAKEFEKDAKFVGTEVPFPLTKLGEEYMTSRPLQYLLPNTFVFDQYGVEGFPTLVYLTHDGEKWNSELIHHTKEVSLSDGLTARLQSR